MTESFAELFEESIASQRIKPGTILTGNVIEVSPEVVIVSAGLKSEAVIPASQFRNEDGDLEVEVGDDVEVALDAVEDGCEQLTWHGSLGQLKCHVLGVPKGIMP